MGPFTVKTDTALPVVSLHSRLDTLTSSSLDSVLEPLVEQSPALIIDFTGCNYLASSGIRVLLKAHKKLAQKGGKLILTGVGREVAQILEVSGLMGLFTVENRKEMLQQLQEEWSGNSAGQGTLSFGGTAYKYRLLPDREQEVCHWIQPGLASFGELGFAAGQGVFAESENSDPENSRPGWFVTTPNFGAMLSVSQDMPSDFRITPDPARTAISLTEAWSFGTHPHLFFNTATDIILPLDKITQAAAWMTMQHQITADTPIMLVIAGKEKSGATVAFMTGIAGKLSSGKAASRISESSFPGISVRLDEPGPDRENQDIRQFLTGSLTFENIAEISAADPGATLSGVSIWVFAAPRFRQGNPFRVVVETDGALILTESERFLVRRLYTDSARVLVQPLHGGYSARTFSVASFDADGRLLRPTVMKMAHRGIITREAERCRRYALPYIFNNSASVLGTEFHGELGVLRYNFVGIGGEESKLKWLTHYYHEESPQFLDPLFDKIFLKILKPWYGQPVKTQLCPFKDHDPTLTFFPNLCATAEELFGISRDDQYNFVEETGRQMLNPYWFLHHEYPARRSQEFAYPASVCHGDLNMQNILIDESMNVYLIDFSETRPRAVVSDFARLEAIFMVDNAPVESKTDLQNYIDYLPEVYAPAPLSQPLPSGYGGIHSGRVAKNLALTGKMRQYAWDHNGHDDNPLIYYMGLLEWVLPVVCYTVPDNTKRVSMIVSALLVERVDDLLKR